MAAIVQSWPTGGICSYYETDPLDLAGHWISADICLGVSPKIIGVETLLHDQDPTQLQTLSWSSCTLYIALQTQIHTTSESTLSRCIRHISLQFVLLNDTVKSASNLLLNGSLFDINSVSSTLVTACHCPVIRDPVRRNHLTSWLQEIQLLKRV